MIALNTSAVCLAGLLPHSAMGPCIPFAAEVPTEILCVTLHIPQLSSSFPHSVPVCPGHVSTCILGSLLPFSPSIHFELFDFQLNQKLPMGLGLLAALPTLCLAYWEKPFLKFKEVVLEDGKAIFGSFGSRFDFSLGRCCINSGQKAPKCR